jgi:DNA-binding NtrC family response regulator
MKETPQGTIWKDSKVRVLVPPVVSIHLPTVVALMEKAYIEKYLIACRGKIRVACRMLGVHHPWMMRKIKQYGLQELLLECRRAESRMDPPDPGNKDGYNGF